VVRWLRRLVFEVSRLRVDLVAGQVAGALEAVAGQVAGALEAVAGQVAGYNDAGAY